MADQVVEKWSLDLSTEEAQKNLDQFANRMTQSFTVGGLAVKGMELAISAMTSAIRTGVKEFMETQVATIRLDAAVKAFGSSSGVTAAQLSGLADRISALTGIESDQLVTLQSTMLMYGVAGDKIEEYTRASVALANVTGTDVESAFQRLLRTQSGVIDRTMKMVPGLADLTKEQLANGEAVGVINEKWGEFVDLNNRGLPGQINQLSLAWKDMSESLVSIAGNSAMLVNALRMVTGEVRDLQAAFESSGWKQYLATTAGLLSGLGPLGALMGESILGKIEGPSAPVGGPSGPAGGGDFTVPGLTINAEKAAKDAARRRKEAAGQSSRTAENRQRNADIIAGIGGTDYGPGQEMAIGMASDETDARFAFNERLNERRMKAEELLTNHLRDQAEARKAILAAEGEAQSEAVREWGDTIQQGVGLGIGALEELVLRGKDAAWRFVVTQLGAIGQRLFMKGMADVAEGFAISANPLTPGLGAPLVAAGLKEMAVGGGLAAGALVAQATSGSFDQGGGGGGGGGGGAAFAGSAGVGGQREPESAQPQPITVILQGPVYDGAAAGVAIAEKIAEARKQGLLK